MHLRLVIAATVALSFTRAWAADIKVDDDKFQPYIQYHTESVTEEPGNGDTYLWAVAANKNRKTGAVEYFVNWSVLYNSTEWRKYSKATLAGGKSLKFQTLDRSLGGCYNYGRCLFREMYSISLSKADVATAAKSGLDIKLYAANPKRNYVLSLSAADMKALQASVK